MTLDNFKRMLTPLREMTEGHIDDCISFLALMGSLRYDSTEAERQEADAYLHELLKRLFEEKGRRHPQRRRRLETKGRVS